MRWFMQRGESKVFAQGCPNLTFHQNDELQEAHTVPPCRPKEGVICL